MKKNGFPTIFVSGNNNKFAFDFNINVNFPNLTTVLLLLAVAVVVLAVSNCCPDKLADVIHWIISMVSGN